MEQPQSLAVFGTKPNEEGTSADQMSEGELVLGDLDSLPPQQEINKINNNSYASSRNNCCILYIYVYSLGLII